MARVSIIAYLAVFILTVSAMAAESSCCQSTTDGCNGVAAQCPAPAWDRTPIYVQQPNNVYLPPTVPPKAWRVDPWAKCGTFCASGQIPVGWPYGWNDEYWLRPNSNF